MVKSKVGLLVKSEPSGAEIFFNDMSKSYGRTPKRFVAEPGSYRVILRFDDGSKWEGPVALRRGDSEKEVVGTKPRSRGGRLPAGFDKAFMLPDSDKDQHGNPVVRRRGSPCDLRIATTTILRTRSTTACGHLPGAAAVHHGLNGLARFGTAAGV